MSVINEKKTGSADHAMIERVGAVAKDALDIQLSNGSILLLNIELILGLPGFGVLAEDDRIYYPKTDGESIYWRDGTRPLLLDEILSLVGKAGKTTG